MTEPTTPDSEPTNEPDVEPDADATAVDLTKAGADADPEPESDVVTGATADPASTSKKNQIIAGVAALVILGVIGVVAAFAFIGGDDEGSSQPASSADEAKAVAVAAFEGIYKVAQKDSSGCEDLRDVLFLAPEQSDFFDQCIAKTQDPETEVTSVVLESVVPTSVTLDEEAGTGTVVADITTSEGGETETASAPIPVTKVDGKWKVNLNP